MTERAKKVAEELEKRGWSMRDDNTKECYVCGYELGLGIRYCPQCGTKKLATFDATTIEDLEAAIAAAMD